MKKYFILMFSISFLFFSCASTNIEDSKTEDSNSQDGNIETVEQTQENHNDFPSENITSENITSEEISDESENLISEQYPELEEIIEPEITDLEWTSETQENQEVPQEKNNENNGEILEEIPEDDILTPTEETFTENLQPEETQSDSQEITENEETNNDENFSQEDEIIDISEDNNFDIVEEIDEVNETDENGNSENFENEKNIIPSRKISLKIGQTLEIEYPGSGWIFMGATDNSKDFTFLGKKLGTENTKFSFKAKNPGNKILHFYKNDILSQNYIDDYLEVEILKEKDSSAKTISAPEYRQQIITKNQQNNEENSLETEIEQTQTSKNNDFENNSIEKTKTNDEELIFDETSNNENKTSLSEEEIESLLIEAKNLFDEKKYQESLSKLNLFIEFSNENRDEALFLQGQIYESNSDYKNIKKALESYKNLTKNYPASSYWDSANKRIIYLTKFYLEGR